MPKLQHDLRIRTNQEYDVKLYAVDNSAIPVHGIHVLLHPCTPRAFMRYMSPMTTEDPFQRLDARRQSRERERLLIQKRLAEINAEDADDAVALRVLRNLYPDGFSNHPQTDAPEKPEAVTPDSASAKFAVRTLPVKTMLLSVLKDAFPGGLTAAQIKGKVWLKYKQEINPNTLTVSLVRASKQKGDEPPRVRCDGRTWYYLRYSEAPNLRPSVDTDHGGIFA